MSLVNQIAARQVAWEFGGSVRVFKVPELIVTIKEDSQTFETASGEYGVDVIGVWLFFEISTQYFKEQIDGTADTDRIDIMNALKASATIYFYPDYENQDTIKYAVKTANGSSTMLKTNRGLFKAEQTIKMRAVTRLADYPSWLKYR